MREKASSKGRKKGRDLPRLMREARLSLKLDLIGRGKERDEIAFQKKPQREASPSPRKRHCADLASPTSRKKRELGLGRGLLVVPPEGKVATGFLQKAIGARGKKREASTGGKKSALAGRSNLCFKSIK